MRAEKLGEGEPEYAVIGSIHGDEPCGKKAINRFLSQNYSVKKPVKLIIANEKALEENVRYLEADLNRSFPGDSESDLYEERLAAKIVDEVEGMKVLDLHSTRSYPEPFATLSFLNSTIRSLIRSTGVDNAVYFPESNGTLNGETDCIVVESGYQQSEQAVENAYAIMVNFLAAEGIIDEEFTLSDPDYYKHSGTVEGSGYKFLAENFQKVREGEVFAENGKEKLEAEESFYPVLMSTDGYKNILGFKAERIENT